MLGAAGNAESLRNWAVWICPPIAKVDLKQPVSCKATLSGCGGNSIGHLFPLRQLHEESSGYNDTQSRKLGNVQKRQGNLSFATSVAHRIAPVDHSHIVAEVTDEYLELGAFTPNVFGWQLTLAMPMFVVVSLCIALPVLSFFGGLVWGEGILDAIGIVALAFSEGLKYATGFGIVILLIALFPTLQAHFKLRGVVPTRFNRQRREVCLVPSDSDTPVIVPWEALQAWVVQAQGVPSMVFSGSSASALVVRIRRLAKAQDLS